MQDGEKGGLFTFFILSHNHQIIFENCVVKFNNSLTFGLITIKCLVPNVTRVSKLDLYSAGRSGRGSCGTACSLPSGSAVDNGNVGILGIIL